MQLIKNMEIQNNDFPDENKNHSDDEDDEHSKIDFDKPHLTNLNEDPLLNNKI